MLSTTKDVSISIENNENLEKVATNLVKSSHEESVDNFNNTINPNLQDAEVKLSPFVCTTRGQKWRPSPRKPPKLSKLFAKYEDDNIADTYRYY